MRFLLDIDITNNKSDFAEKFYKTISLVKNASVIASNEITTPSILQSIKDYENNLVKPTPFSLNELKALINA